MNVNCPKFIDKMRQRKAERRDRHREEMGKRLLERAQRYKERLSYWEKYDKLLTEYLKSAKENTTKGSPL
jgi:guanylate kinase